MANDKKLSSALAVDVATGLPKSYGIDSVSTSLIPIVTSSTTPSSTTGLAVLMDALTTLPEISPTMKSIAGTIGIGLCIRTSPLLKGLCETASTLEVQKMNDKKWYYPCNYCGECPIWLAAFDHPGLKTYEDVIEVCEAKGCPLVGQEVLQSDLV